MGDVGRCPVAPLYHLGQQFRWEKDWPILFGLLTSIPEALVLKFANRADLMRVKGIAEEYADLLEAAGVDTVPELARRNAANLAQALLKVNEDKKLTRRLPAETEVAKWIEQAKQLPRVLEY